MKKTLIVLGAIGVTTFLAVMGAIVYVGMAGPETFVQSGRQVPDRFVREIRKLGLLESGEVIQHFYSDALLDIKGGFYAATDRKLILYSDAWNPPQIVVKYADIDDISAVYSGSWLEDSVVSVTLSDGSTADFPLSSERGGDRRFVQFVRGRIPPK